MRTITTLSLADALTAIEAAQDCARADDITMAIAVVDVGGGLIALQTMDGTQPAGAEVAVAKARAAALFRRPTAAFEKVAHELGKPSVLLLPSVVPNALAVEGGLPVLLDEAVVGAVGVSGGSGAQDAKVAGRAVASLSPSGQDGPQ